MLFVATWANSSWLKNFHLGTHNCRSPEHLPSRRDVFQREKGITFSDYLLLLAESRLARAEMAGQDA
jgi:hypothetical protein